MQPVLHRSRFVHHVQVVSPDFSRYLSHSITILPDAQGHNDAHGACAAGLPGICDVNLVSHTMGDDKSPSARSRGICKPEKPTQGAPARTGCPTPAAKSAPSGAHSAQITQVCEWRTRPIERKWKAVRLGCLAAHSEQMDEKRS